MNKLVFIQTSFVYFLEYKIKVTRESKKNKKKNNNTKFFM